MSDISRRDVLLGTTAVIASATLPALPELYPAINEIVRCVERPTQVMRWFLIVDGMPDMLLPGGWVVSEGQ